MHILICLILYKYILINMSILLWQIFKILFIVLDHVTVLSISFLNVTVFKNWMLLWVFLYLDVYMWLWLFP